MYRLKMKKFRVWFHLGCTEEERKRLQPVDISLSLYFDKPPVGCKTDNIEDVVDFGAFVNITRTLSLSREFHLVENLAYTLFVALVEHIGGRANKLTVVASKLSPPVDGISGVSFKYSGAIADYIAKAV